jgi:hypothetical protein
MKMTTGHRVDSCCDNHGRRAIARATVATFVAACLLALLADVGAAQDDVVRIDGRVLWIAAQTMIVAPYESGSDPINVDLSKASQDEYMRLTTGDSVTITGTIAEAGNRVVATSIRARS